MSLASEAVDWAVSRWNDEVKNRPLQNVNRRPLDDTWRQVIRHFGGDDEMLCGPRHDELLVAAKAGTRGQGLDWDHRAVNTPLDPFAPSR